MNKVTFDDRRDHLLKEMEEGEAKRRRGLLKKGVSPRALPIFIWPRSR